MAISDFLLQHGFAISAHEEAFVQWQYGWKRVEIPFSMLAGHTLESFKELMKKKDWLAENPQDFFDEPVVGLFSWGTNAVQ